MANRRFVVDRENLPNVSGRHCQTNLIEPVEPRGLSGYKLTPLGQGNGAVEFEALAVVKMTFLVEMIVDRGVGCRKSLRSNR